MCVSVLLDKTIAMKKRELHAELRKSIPCDGNAMYTHGYDSIMEVLGALGCVTCRSYTYEEFDAILTKLESAGAYLFASRVGGQPHKAINAFEDLLNLKLYIGANIYA